MLHFLSNNLLLELLGGGGQLGVCAWPHHSVDLMTPVLGELLFVFLYWTAASSLAWLHGGYIWPARLYLLQSGTWGAVSLGPSCMLTPWAGGCED